MALQVWLPLNGDLNNYGVSGLKVVQTTAPTYVNGKIGKAMSTGAFYLPAADVAKFYNGNTMSWAFWIYPTGTGSVVVPILGQSSTAAGDCRMFTIYQYPNMVDLHLSWQNEGGGNFLSAVYSNAFTANTWNHCVVTYDNPTCKVYINGDLKQTYSGASTRTNFTYNVPIPSTSARYLNDFRIYDHCLTPKEVKEISKGLVVHFPLNDQFNNAIVNKYSLPQAAGSPSSSTWTVTKLANERGYNYKGTRTGDGANSWWNFRFPTFTFTVGKRYYYSLKCRCNKFTNASLTLRAARSSNDYVTNGVNICSSTLADGQWHEYSCSQIINETYERSGTTVTCAPCLEAYTTNMNGNGTVYEMDFDIKDIQVIESDTYVPFIENAFANDIVYDTSGFGYNGKRVGSLELTSDTPRYNIATLFQKAGYLDNPNFKMDLYAFTLTFWVNFQTPTSQHFLFGTFDSWTNNGIGIWRDTATPLKYTFLIRSNTASSYTTSAMTVSALNTWNFMVISYDGTLFKGYLNGVLQFSVTYGGNGYVINKNLMVGNSKYNSTPASENEECILSDFRLYATALSDADILELYQKPVSINQHSMMTQGEFVEG